MNSAEPPKRAQTPVPVPTSDLLPGTIVGEYEVVGKIGEGGMGAVFAAVHPLIGKRVAIKVITRELAANAETVERFVQEARSVNSIGHEGIIDIFSFGTLPDGRPYFVMEWLQGEPVAGRLKRGPLDTVEAAHILDQICRALDAAHEKGIIHRDLKPDNVFLVEARGERPIVKLLDFGLAKLIGSSDVRLRPTRSGAIVGTPLYISPEQARGEGVGAPTDVYALGCMAFELLVGHPPFIAGSAIDVIIAHVQTRPPRASSIRPGIAPELDRLVLKMLEKRPGDRPLLAEIRATLKPFLVAVEAPPAVTFQRSDEREREVLFDLDGTPLDLDVDIEAVRLQNDRRLRPRVVPREDLPPAAPTPSVIPKNVPAAYRALSQPALIIAGVVVCLGVAIGVVEMRRGTVPTVDLPVQLVPAVEGPKTQAPVVPPVDTPATTPRVTGTVVVTVDAPARIEVDGQVVEESATTGRMDVDRVGDHVVVVTAPGRAQVRKKVMVAESATVVVPVRLARSVGSRPEPRTQAPSVAPTVLPSTMTAPAKQSTKPTIPPVTQPEQAPSKPTD